MKSFEFSDDFVDLPVYGLAKDDKSALHLAHLKRLDQHHQKRCPLYKQLVSSDLYQQIVNEPTLNQAGFPLAVRHFKDELLSSIDDKDRHKTLYSSGTSGSASRITLDQKSARLQSVILIKTLQQWLGKSRRPMLVIDTPDVLKGATANTARAAAIKGFATFSRSISYALNPDYSINDEVINTFFEQNNESPVLMFGFTFIVWQHFIQQLLNQGKQFQHADMTLFHGGGWKKLAHLAVNTATFNKTSQLVFPKLNVHDYYGMVEQTGTIHISCNQGHFHAPVWADIFTRRPWNLSFADHGELGLIQMNSLIAASYPGHRLLTEDLGTILGEDDCPCGLKGKYFTVQGRVPSAEKRGCSDAV